MHTSIHKWVGWGGVIRIRLEFKSRGWHVYANLLPMSPSIDVRPFPAAAIASPFNWSRREHKLPPHWRPPAALLLSWTWSICPRFFLIRISEPLGLVITLMCNREWSNCKLIWEQRVLRQLAPERFVFTGIERGSILHKHSTAPSVSYPTESLYRHPQNSYRKNIYWRKCRKIPIRKAFLWGIHENHGYWWTACSANIGCFSETQGSII